MIPSAGARCEKIGQRNRQHIHVKGDGDKGLAQLVIVEVVRHSLRNPDNIVFYSSRSLNDNRWH